MLFQKISIRQPHPPPTPGKGNSERRGLQKEAISEGVEVASGVFSLGAPSKIDEQAISYYTVNLCFKAKSIVFIDNLLIAVSWRLFSRLAR